MMNAISYSRPPIKTISLGTSKVHIFTITEENLDKNTVNSFGDEWSKFSQFSKEEIELIGNDYFDIVPSNILNPTLRCLDVGCGSGRWSIFLSPKVGFIEAIDPSEAAFIAARNVSHLDNVRVSMADAGNMPFEDNSFDLVFSLGVLHHIPDTFKAMQHCVNKVKPGGYFLVYLYYSLDNRGLLYKCMFHASTVLRRIISRLPSKVKKFVAEALAVFLYLPLIALSRFFLWINLPDFVKKIPLHYYTKTSWRIIRNDALDRFGTPLEQRFSKKEIERMMTRSGLTDIHFSQEAPFWHAIGKKPVN